VEAIPRETEEVARRVLDASFAVHRALGPGLLESIYEVCLVHELRKTGLGFEQQLVLPIQYDTVRIDAGLRLDLLVGECVVVELKAVECLLPVHRAQVLTYLKLSGHRLGILINFNVPVLKDGTERIAP
jgi:GxxExxY protein